MAGGRLRRRWRLARARLRALLADSRVTSSMPATSLAWKPKDVAQDEDGDLAWRQQLQGGHEGQRDGLGLLVAGLRPGRHAGGTLEEGVRKRLHPLAERLGCRLEVKDEGKHYPGFGGNPTLSFKDRGMAMTVSMARSLGLTRLAVPTQGNAGDSLAEYAVAAGIEAVIVMSPDTDLPVLGKVAAYARLYPENVKLEIVPGTIIDCGKRVREEYVPRGYFSVATFQEPGWRTEGKKTLGLEMAEPAGERLGRTALAATRRDRLSDRRRNRASSAWPRRSTSSRRWAWSAPSGPGWSASRARPARRSSARLTQGRPTSSPRPPGRTIATGLNVAQNLGHINVLRIIRETGGCASSVTEEAIRDDDPRRVARAAVRLVAGGSRDARRPSRAGRPRDDPPRRPGRPGQHGLGREIPADDPRASGRSAAVV